MPTDHTVRDGESIQTLAHQAGLFWETVWLHGNNATLKNTRKDPDVLLPGDVVHLPDPEPGKAQGGTEKTHRFRLKGVPAKFVMILTTSKAEEEADEEPPDEPWSFTQPAPRRPVSEPHAKVPYQLFAGDKQVKEGTTGTDGKIEAPIPGGATTGRLVLFPGEVREQSIDLQWGHMDPLEEAAGVCQRLNNLGYPVAQDGGESSVEFKQAVLAFQREHELEPTGEITQATRDKLKEVFGG